MVTLFHYTHPQWFHDRIGWTDPRAVATFTRFAASVVTAFSPHVRMYTILNEPLVFLLAGYVDGQIPPGISDTRAAGKALENLLRAHASTAAMIRQKQPSAAIGIAHNMMSFAPERPYNILDRLLVRTAHRFLQPENLGSLRHGKVELPPASIHPFPRTLR